MRITIEDMKKMGFQPRERRSIEEIRGGKSQDRKAAACDGKTRHQTKDGAIWAATHTSAVGVGAEPYLCTFCNGWHIGVPRYK